MLCCGVLCCVVLCCVVVCFLKGRKEGKGNLGKLLADAAERGDLSQGLWVVWVVTQGVLIALDRLFRIKQHFSHRPFDMKKAQKKT